MFVPVVMSEVSQSSWGYLSHQNIPSQLSWCDLWSVHLVICLWPSPWKRADTAVALPSKVTQMQLDIFFHHLKHLIFPTFLLLCGVTCFPELQIKPNKAREFEAHMRDTQKKCWITLWHLPGAPVHTSVLCSNCSLQETCWSSQCGYHSTLNPGVWDLLNHWVLTHCLWMCL